jgi:hypothetical protein
MHAASHMQDMSTWLYPVARRQIPSTVRLGRLRSDCNGRPTFTLYCIIAREQRRPACENTRYTFPASWLEVAERKVLRRSQRSPPRYFAVPCRHSWCMRSTQHSPIRTWAAAAAARPPHNSGLDVTQEGRDCRHPARCRYGPRLSASGLNSLMSSCYLLSCAVCDVFRPKHHATTSALHLGVVRPGRAILLARREPYNRRDPRRRGC